MFPKAPHPVGLTRLSFGSRGGTGQETTSVVQCSAASRESPLQIASNLTWLTRLGAVTPGFTTTCIQSEHSSPGAMLSTRSQVIRSPKLVVELGGTAQSKFVPAPSVLILTGIAEGVLFKTQPGRVGMPGSHARWGERSSLRNDPVKSICLVPVFSKVIQISKESHSHTNVGEISQVTAEAHISPKGKLLPVINGFGNTVYETGHPTTGMVPAFTTMLTSKLSSAGTLIEYLPFLSVNA